MATIVTRAGKGSPLTHEEVDANFTNLNDEAATKAPLASPAFTNNVGIGTTSPDFPLDVSSTGVGSTIVSRFYVTDNTVGLLRVGNSTTGDGATAPAFGANATSAVIHTNNTERMRIDASGNLGLGVTPSAWTRKALQIGDAAAAYVANGSGGATVIATNMFFDGANKYATTAAASRYSVGTGTHEWYNAPSGTAGNAITFTQAMTLDASSNLTVAGNVTAYSDARLKTNVRTVPDALGLVQKMRGVFFDKDDTPSVGVIAQEMEEVLPEVVHDGEYKSVAYGNIVGVLIEAIKAQQAQIDELKAKLGV